MFGGSLDQAVADLHVRAGQSGGRRQRPELGARRALSARRRLKRTQTHFGNWCAALQLPKAPQQAAP